MRLYGLKYKLEVTVLQYIENRQECNGTQYP